MNWQRILVPHDFSGGAARAQALAGDLALACGGRVVLLHVTPLPPGMLPTTLIRPGDDGPGEITVEDYTTRAAAERLAHWARPVKARGVEVECLALVGGIAETILAQAQELRADVIVMGTHGRRGLAHLLLGSIAEKVIRQADVPVVTVRSAGDGDELLEPELR